MKRLLLFALLLCGRAFAQQGNTLTLYHAGAPTGSCGPLMLYVNATTGDLYSCVSGAWHLVSGGGSSPLTTKGDLFGFSTVNARVPVGSDGLCLKADSSNGLGVSYSACAGAATGYQTIQNAAAAITQRTILNWTAGIVCADNAGATRSDCALANVSAVSHKFFNAVVLGALSAGEPASTDLADFSTTAPAANGKIPIYDTSAPNAAGGTGAYVPGDPLVQGTQAAGSTTLPNPVVIGGSDYSGTPTVRTAKVDSSGIVQTHETGTPTVTANAGSGTLATSSTQLPAALDGSGFLKTHEQGTAAISAASLPLPTGAATSAKQPALGTAGTASADVITIQGKAGMTAVVVDGSGVTQPISGTVTANQGTSPWVVSCTAGNCTVEVADGSGNKITTNSSTYTAKFAFDTNLLGTLGTAFSTAGKVDVKGADGDMFVRQATGTNLHMVCDSGCSSSAGFADSAAFTVGTTAINPIGGLFDDTPPTAITTGKAASARITNNRALHINLRNQAGTEIGTSGAPLRTDPTGTTTQPISAASLPLPTGAAADSSLTTLDTDVKANVTLHAGANLIGKAGFDGTTPGNTNGITQFQPSRTTGTITTSSTSIPVATTGYGVATVTVNGTYAGVTVNFEFSDDGGTTYYPTTCTRTDSNTQEGTAIVLASNKSQAWDCGVFAATNFRVRSSAFTSGTANIGITLSAAPIEPAPTVSVSGTVPVSGTVTTTPPSNASTNVAQVAGTTTDTNSGTKSAGTLRVVLATDQPALTNKLLVTPDSVALPANQSVNVSQINAVTPLMGNGTTGTGSQRVTIASDNTAFAVNAAATLAAETTKVIGTVRAQGNLGAAFDAATGAAVPANAVMGGLKDTAGNTQDALADTNGRQFFKQYPDTTTTSYRASKKFAASSTTDNAVMPGNATNTVLVTKILVTCNQTTAGQINVELLKRSVADTVGTSAAMTVVPMDANYAAAVSAPLSYTGTGPTVGTAVGDLDNLQIGCMAPGTATPNDIFIFHPDKPIILRGTAQQIAVNVGNAALTGGNITVTFEWEETTTP